MLITENSKTMERKWMILFEDFYPELGRNYDILLDNGEVIYDVIYDEDDDKCFFDTGIEEIRMDNVSLIKKA